ncbi:hypothetical protein ACPPVS_08890 [Cellulomonas sp. McL0617]|uniref:hypothetical protein n=1 Tax=Cellulomonas sp. McL0617 TaxID=3415675 RepID=UPI003CEE7E56
MSTSTPVRARFWVFVVVAAAAFILFVVTLISREWIEEVFHVDPDEGSGSLEWLIVAGTALVALVLGILARLEWRRPRAAVTA